MSACDCINYRGYEKCVAPERHHPFTHAINKQVAAMLNGYFEAAGYGPGTVNSMLADLSWKEGSAAEALMVRTPLPKFTTHLGIGNDEFLCETKEEDWPELEVFTEHYAYASEECCPKCLEIMRMVIRQATSPTDTSPTPAAAKAPPHE